MRYVTAAIALTGMLMVANAAYAGCKPACGADEKCRYAATTGKFYCESTTSKSGKDLKMDRMERQVEGSGLPLRGGQPPLR